MWIGKTLIHNIITSDMTFSFNNYFSGTYKLMNIMEHCYSDLCRYKVTKYLLSK